MQNNFYTKPKFNNPNTISKRKYSALFLDYLGHFIFLFIYNFDSNSAKFTLNL